MMLSSSRSQNVSGRPAAVAVVKVLLLAIAQIPLIRALPTPLSQSLNELEEGKPASDPSLWLYLGIAAALVLSGGAFAGLTIALMGQVRRSPPVGSSYVHMHEGSKRLTDCRMRFIYRSFKHRANCRRRRTLPACWGC
jgi:hypothetical protein